MEPGAKNVEANSEAADAVAGPSALAEDELPVPSNSSSLSNHDMSTDESASGCRAFAACLSFGNNDATDNATGVTGSGINICFSGSSAFVNAMSIDDAGFSCTGSRTGNESKLGMQGMAANSCELCLLEFGCMERALEKVMGNGGNTALATTGSVTAVTATGGPGAEAKEAKGSHGDAWMIVGFSDAVAGSVSRCCLGFGANSSMSDSNHYD